MLVNDIPLGPNAMIVWVDIPTCPEAFLWRPTPNMTYIEDAIGTKVAWPANKVVLENSPNIEEVGNLSSPSIIFNSFVDCTTIILICECISSFYNMISLCLSCC
ncbi:hypothetical protein RchiOBHm_Chr7g0177401 [Rosa chinensis]|uniref:Transposase, Tnp1/En/Spm n=1 Tax=Rosa chinensis TaxID=74649 RepID=A0A2P6P1I9_ROSCH|nr:hypothetical protein RchiOBHm_Chr7g0177401 [Rosa chinensis]